ncbi:Prenylcysteine lyase-domain-containing protein [Lipomyces tetrasporus]|uniref:Prenylcysteine lyase-domain-containing protein n=1 Tax=Lipomyces tetrasporus TaxID=54092 RepID=A0AAD7QSM9_9ASCO|nr:Prenylcysteine lyase-domain-containing protein [Lipomyces tetrasporus]KAJ8100700.1 Prenylcysteine lyase-domain-containing protein [Lipomyces tetrasporus]
MRDTMFYAIPCVLLPCVLLSVNANEREEVFQSPLSEPLYQETSKEKIAIIGAGAGGSSSAYYLQLYSNYSYDITVFEKNDYIGGRTTTIDVHNDPRWPVEVGASVFVKENFILATAAKEFGLTVQTHDSGKVCRKDGLAIEDSFGIWDGKDFVFTASSESTWKSTIKLLYQYGTAPVRARLLSKKTIASFLAFYSENYFPFEDLTEIAQSSGLTNLTSETTFGYFTGHGMSDRFVNEIVQAATRVNYAQNVKQLHALEGFVCLAADEALQIEGGNWQIFEKMLQKSGAILRLGTVVSEIVNSKESSGKWEIRIAASDKVEKFDEVIIAAPYQQTGIGGSALGIKEVPYITLYVTIFTSTKRLSPMYFGLKPGVPVPTMILTTLPDDNQAGSHMPPVFNSISIIRYIPEKNEYVYKIFSPSRTTPEFLQLIFEKGAEFTWVHEKTWNSYPRLNRIRDFSALRVDDGGIWYLNGIEQFISTMETSSLSGCERGRAHCGCQK